MPYTDVTLTEGRRCGSCGHPEVEACPCSCCPASYEFAGVLDALATKALRDDDYQMAEYFMDAADYWAGEPDEMTLTLRLMLLNAAIGRNEG